MRYKLLSGYRLPKYVWIAERYDGRYWAGEYKWHGATFVRDPKYAYRWGSQSACRCAVSATEWNTASYTVDTVLPVEVNYADLLENICTPRRHKFR